MKFSVDKQEQYSIIKLEEDKLDSTLAPGIKSEFVTLHAEGVKNIILDLSEVKYTDSSGLSALLVGNRIFQEDQGIFVLAAMTDHVKKLITISQLDSVLTIQNTVDEAIDYIGFELTERALKNELGEGEDPA